MARTFFRVSTFAAATAIAAGTFAWSDAAPRRAGDAPAHPAASEQAFTVAALNRRGSDDPLADDAAAAGETGLARPGQYGVQPYRAPAAEAPPAAADDPLQPLLDGAPEPRSYAQGYLSEDAGQGEPERARIRRHPALHHRLPHRRTALAAEAPPASAAAKAAGPASPAPRPSVVRPHRVRIILEPQRKPALTAPPADPATVVRDLPSVEIAPAADVEAQLAELTRAASADMQGVKVDLAPQLSAGREGAVVLTLPAQLLSDLTYRAEDSDPDTRAMTITVRLSGQGWQVAPSGAQTVSVTAARPATFVWRASPSGSVQGSLIAEMNASLSLEGQPVTLPLGTLALQLPPPVLSPPAAQAESASAPESDGGLALPDLSRLSWRTLAIPGQPTVQVPGLGEVASGKLVAAGLLLLVLLFLRELLHRPIERRQRRRALRDLETAGFGGSYS